MAFGGNTELYNALLTGVQTLSKFTATFPRAGGNLTPINNLSSAGFVPIIGPNPSRNNISFHNPGTAPVYVAPTVFGSSGSGGVFSPTPTQLGGTFEVIPGDWVTLSGLVQMGFQAWVTAGSSQPFTVMDQ